MSERPPKPRNWLRGRSERRRYAVGLQARSNPALIYIDSRGYVGEIMAAHVRMIRDGVLTRPSHRTWERDATLGANTLTITNGHTDHRRDAFLLSAMVVSGWLNDRAFGWIHLGGYRMEIYARTVGPSRERTFVWIQHSANSQLTQVRRAAPWRF